MSTKTPISYSQIKLYNTCHRKYYLHYRKRLRSKYKHVALFYGSALDQALNAMLLGTEDPYAVFERSFSFAEINKKGELEPVAENPRVVYAEKDLQPKLLDKNDQVLIEAKAQELGVYYSDSFISQFIERKAEEGLSDMPENLVKLYNYINFRCMLQKGRITIESYLKEVKPKIKTVIAVQEKIEATNADGDSLIGFADILLEMHDGKRVLFDHKTSAFEYAADSAEHSSQLTLYYHFLKEKYNLTHVGYIVMLKRMRDRAEKTCKDCGHKVSNRVKTCDNVIGGLRCGGAISEETQFECPIQIITSNVSEFTENLVAETFDGTNKAIKVGDWSPNLESCKSFNGLICDYINYCHSGSTKDLEQL